MRISITITDLDEVKLAQLAKALGNIGVEKDIEVEDTEQPAKKRKWSRKARLMAKQGMRKDGTPRKKRVTKIKETA
jgi:hypothetical protein